RRDDREFRDRRPPARGAQRKPAARVFAGVVAVDPLCERHGGGARHRTTFRWRRKAARRLVARQVRRVLADQCGLSSRNPAWPFGHESSPSPGAVMTPTITAFAQSPDRGQGLARDMRVRWALEEVGQPYEVRLLSFKAMKEPAHLALHPFGQIPTYEEGDLALFESGSIVFHLAERHAGLLPDDPNGRARAIAWMFADINTVEPPILDLQTAKFLEGDKSWAAERLPLVIERIRKPLHVLSGPLGEADWLEGQFSAGDLMMIAVLLRLKPSGILDEFPQL